MLLPQAPRHYDVRDQNQVRRILERGLSETIDRLVALEGTLVNPPPPPPPGAAALRIGLANSRDIIGEGPAVPTVVGGRPFSFDSPIFTAAGYDFTIQPNEVIEKIELADEYDVPIIMAPSRGRFGYIDENGFSRTLYEQKVRAFEDIPEFADAVQRQRVFLMIGDEFNHPNFDVAGVGTCHPADVNWMGNLHKSIWPGALTFVRQGKASLVDGWNSSGALGPNFWTGLDYGWAQRAGQHNDETLDAYYDAERTALLANNIGLVPGFNLWNGGIKLDAEEVDACWDMQNDGTSSGYIIGQLSDPSGSRQGCGSIDTGLGHPRVVASPDWIRRYADVVSEDADAPFTIIWANAWQGPLNSDEPWGVELQGRTDIVDALDYAITKTSSRASFNGLRTAKTGDPI